MIYIMFAIYVLLSSSGLLLFKYGSNGIAISFIKGLNMSFSWVSLIGILCYVVSFILWLVIVSKVKLSWAFPLSVALTNLFIYLGSIFLLKEPVTWQNIVGILLITIGVSLIGMGVKTK